jgi:hypothetical protein
MYLTSNLWSHIYPDASHLDQIVTISADLEYCIQADGHFLISGVGSIL